MSDEWVPSVEDFGLRGGRARNALTLWLLEQQVGVPVKVPAGLTPTLSKSDGFGRHLRTAKKASGRQINYLTAPDGSLWVLLTERAS